MQPPILLKVRMMGNIVTAKVIYFHDEKLILDIELPGTLLNSLRHFSIMTSKNVSETAHDEYIKRTNDILRQYNPPAQDDVSRRGENLELLGKCQFESSTNHR